MTQNYSDLLRSLDFYGSKNSREAATAIRELQAECDAAYN